MAFAQDSMLISMQAGPHTWETIVASNNNTILLEVETTSMKEQLPC